MAKIIYDDGVEHEVEGLSAHDLKFLNIKKRKKSIEFDYAVIRFMAFVVILMLVFIIIYLLPIILNEPQCFYPRGVDIYEHNLKVPTA